VPEHIERGRAVAGRERGVTLALEAVAQRVDQVLLIVDEEDRASHNIPVVYEAIARLAPQARDIAVTHAP
jgi:hypothetical protein